GFFLGSIDRGAFADTDGLPEMDQMTLVADRLFVSLERLDRRLDFAPAGKSLLAVIDTATDGVVGTVELSGGNAFGETAGLVHEPRTGKLVVAEAGNIFRTGDGALGLAARALPAPGIRIFDVASDRPLTTGAIGVGLPPFAMAFVP